MLCKNCGTQLPEDAVVCTVCGAQVENRAPLPADPATLPQNSHPMKWHKFLIYFQLFLAAILNALTGLGRLATLDIFYGAVYIATAVLAIYARFRLAGFRQNGPTAYMIFLGFNCALNALNLINVIGTEIYAVSSAVSALVTTVVMLILTNIYYKKRADLFIN